MLIPIVFHLYATVEAPKSLVTARLRTLLLMARLTAHLVAKLAEVYKQIESAIDYSISALSLSFDVQHTKHDCQAQLPEPLSLVFCSSSPPHVH